jgi:hypothetical protein
MTEVLCPILHNADYDMVVVPGQINHNLVGLIQHSRSYTATWTAAFPRPVRPEVYNPNILENAIPVVRNQMKAAHAAVVANFEIYTAAKK